MERHRRGLPSPAQAASRYARGRCLRAGFMLAMLFIVVAPSLCGSIPLMRGMARERERKAKLEDDDAAEGGKQEGDTDGKGDPFHPQDGDDQEMSSDWQSFSHFDDDGDSQVGLEEWLHHVIGVSPDVSHAEVEMPEGVHREAEENAVKERWRTEFAAADKDRDGKLTFKEWQSMMVHDEPQHPDFVDGRPLHADSDEDHMKVLFKKYDDSRDGFLTATELDILVKEVHTQDVEHQLEGTEGKERELIKQQLEDEWLQEAITFSAHVMDELDKNKDHKLSAREWEMYEYV